MRELKAALSAHLRRVRNGESVLVTDRGRPVARIVPVGMPEGLARLMREGKLSWSGRKPVIPRSRPRLRGRGPTLAEMVTRDRG